MPRSGQELKGASQSAAIATGVVWSFAIDRTVKSEGSLHGVSAVGIDST